MSFSTGIVNNHDNHPHQKPEEQIDFKQNATHN